MTLPTVQLTCMVSDPDGQPAIGDIFRATLDKTDICPSHSFVAPAVIEAIADANGAVIFKVWPNELGTESSRYRVVAISPDSQHKYLDVLVTVPNRPCMLHELADKALNLVRK